MIFFTADHHFGHENIISYVKRPFVDAEEMDRTLVLKWNSVVRKQDIVYHLGDFTLSNYDYAESIIDRLNGMIAIVPGGHDKRWIKRANEHKRVSVLSGLIEVNVEHEVIVLCHYPLLTWERSHYGSLHLHGHCHGTIGKAGYAGNVLLPPDMKNGVRVDVGVDCWDFYPVTLEQIKETIL